jgi:hypothetical protein
MSLPFKVFSTTSQVIPYTIQFEKKKKKKKSESLSSLTIIMGLGVLEDHQLEHVPGTAPLNELGREVYNTSGVDSAILKHDPTGKIVLVPQPSDSPNDPYNWFRWKKEKFTIAFAFSCGAVGGKFPSNHC